MIAIIDYQMGNLAQRSKRVCQGRPRCHHYQRSGTCCERADKIVLPGVGAFGDAMEELRRRDLSNRFAPAVARERRFWAFAWGCSFCSNWATKEGGTRALAYCRARS